MSILSQHQLAQIIAGNPHVEHWHEVLDKLLEDYDINTPQRVASFLAQCAHESNNFVFIKENLNYRAASLVKTFAKYFPDDATAAAYAGLSSGLPYTVQEEEKTKYGTANDEQHFNMLSKELMLLSKYINGFSTDSPTALYAAK